MEASGEEGTVGHEIAVRGGKENRVEFLEKLGTRKGQVRAKGSCRETVIKGGGNLGKGDRSGNTVRDQVKENIMGRDAKCEIETSTCN